MGTRLTLVGAGLTLVGARATLVNSRAPRVDSRASRGFVWRRQSCRWRHSSPAGLPAPYRSSLFLVAHALIRVPDDRFLPQLDPVAAEVFGGVEGAIGAVDEGGGAEDALVGGAVDAGDAEG